MAGPLSNFYYNCYGYKCQKYVYSSYPQGLLGEQLFSLQLTWSMKSVN